jgi:hypothetical protein
MEKDLFGNTTAKRNVICDDMHKWISTKKNIKAIITSLPDMEEVNMSLIEWELWIKKTVDLIIESLDDNGIVIFYQTDRKYKGRVIDKKALISEGFMRLGYKNIFNKIVLKQKPETVNLFRPTFTNLFGFSKNITSGKATPDVIYAGKMLYKNAMGFNACKSSVDFIKLKIDTNLIVDPFCGQGSVLKIANDFGFDSIGVEILNDQCLKALKLK